jgi:hypothetical protein
MRGAQGRAIGRAITRNEERAAGAVDAVGGGSGRHGRSVGQGAGSSDRRGSAAGAVGQMVRSGCRVRQVRIGQGQRIGR